MSSPLEVCSLSRAKNFSSGYQPEYLRGWPSQAHDTYWNLLSDIVFLPGRLFVGIREGMGRRIHCGNSLEGVDAKAGFRMEGLRSICMSLITHFLSLDHAHFDSGGSDSRQ